MTKDELLDKLRKIVSEAESVLACMEGFRESVEDLLISTCEEEEDKAD